MAVHHAQGEQFHLKDSRASLGRRSMLGLGAGALGLALVGTVSTPANAFTLGESIPFRKLVGPRISQALKKHRGRIYADRPGQVIEGLDIEGDVVIRAPRVTVRNCVVRGMRGISNSRGLVDCTHRDVRDAVVENCDLFVDPRWATYWYTGVQGHHVTVRRCHIHEVADGVGIMNPHNPRSTSTVIEGNLIENLAYFAPVSTHSDGRTHNDCIQHQGGSGDIIRGNFLSANPSRVNGNGLSASARIPNEFRDIKSVPGQCIAITPVLTTVTDITISKNWLRHGQQSLNVISGSHRGTNIGRITGNRFLGGNPSTMLSGQRIPRSMVVVPGMSADGLPSRTGPDRNGNVDSQGRPVTVWRIPLS